MPKLSRFGVGVLLSALVALSAAAEQLSFASANLKWTGWYKEKQDLSAILEPHDLVVIQELVSTPVRIVSGGRVLKADGEAQRFVSQMAEVGFHYHVSEMDSGPGRALMSNHPRTEFSLFLYRPDKVQPVTDSPFNGYISRPLADHPVFSRVPYAMAFRSVATGREFVVVNVHLSPGDDREDYEQREREWVLLRQWVKALEPAEADVIVAGDTNAYSCDRLSLYLGDVLEHANDECLGTNLGRSKPYDVVALGSASDMSLENFQVHSLHQHYPAIRQLEYAEAGELYSDHHPVSVTLNF